MGMVFPLGMMKIFWSYVVVIWHTFVSVLNATELCT